MYVTSRALVTLPGMCVLLGLVCSLYLLDRLVLIVVVLVIRAFVLCYFLKDDTAISAN